MFNSSYALYRELVEQNAEFSLCTTFRIEQILKPPARSRDLGIAIQTIAPLQTGAMRGDGASGLKKQIPSNCRPSSPDGIVMASGKLVVSLHEQSVRRAH